MNRCMRAVTTAAQEFVNVASAIGPLHRTLSANAQRQYESRLAEQERALRELEARAHGTETPPADGSVFTAFHASTAGWSDPVWTRFQPLPSTP